MSDVFTKAKRSAVMSRIRGAGNRDTELRLIALMRAAGITGWGRGAKLRFAGRSPRSEIRGQRSADTESSTPSVSAGRLRTLRSLREKSPPAFTTIRPDFVFRRQRVAVFVDGCFFHGCPQHATWPRNNAAFWRAKIEGNMARDRLQNRILRAHGWRVLRVWEHALARGQAAGTIRRVRRVLTVRRR